MSEQTEDLSTTTEAYGSTKRASEFTSEKFKLEISNLPKHVKYHVVKQLCERCFKLSPHKIRVGNGRAYVAFVSEDERDDAIAKIHNQEWKGRTLSAQPACARHDPFVERLKNTDTADSAARESQDQAITEESVNDQVCPFWSKSYEDQIKCKDLFVRSVLNIGKQVKKLHHNLQKDDPTLYNWVQANEQICCQFDGVIHSPVINGYRNKCEFNVGQDGTIGFRLGRYKDGSERVAKPPKRCPIVGDVMFSVLNNLQNFLDNKAETELRGYNHVTHEGNVRQLTIRTNSKNQCLIIVDLHPQDLSEDVLNKEIRAIVKTLTYIENVVSIYVNISENNHFKETEQTLKLVHGTSHLYENMFVDLEKPLKFRIGPTSFFQINTKAAEMLYRSIKEVANLNTKTMLLDVGCGTGTIGISLANQVNYVIGIEIVQSAVDDAKVNASENGISNITFFAGKAEELIRESIAILKGKLKDQASDGEIVAIVDPPRVGFNNSFIKHLRASNIKKIVYVACDPKANTNLVSLCRPKSKAYHGNPFVPTRARAFDLFPHTKFCELLIVYERLEESSSTQDINKISPK